MRLVITTKLAPFQNGDRSKISQNGDRSKKIKDGQLRVLNNWSGHYQPQGVTSGIPEGAWRSHGFDEAMGLYKETLTPQ